MFDRYTTFKKEYSAWTLETANTLIFFFLNEPAGLIFHGVFLEVIWMQAWFL